MSLDSDGKADGATKTPFESFVAQVTATRQRLLVGKIRLWIVQIILPILFSTAKWAPYIFLSLEIMKRDGSTEDIGLAYLTINAAGTVASLVTGCRNPASTNLFPLYLLPLTFSIAGWVAAIALQDEGPSALLLTAALIGLSEANSIMQTQLLAELKDDSPKYITLIQGRVTGPALRLRQRKPSWSGAAALVQSPCPGSA